MTDEKKVITTADGRRYRVPILPIPVEFDYISEDISPLTGGGFVCRVCMAVTESPNVAELPHEDWCASMRSTLTHGEARAAYLAEKAKDQRTT